VYSVCCTGVPIPRTRTQPPAFAPPKAPLRRGNSFHGSESCNLDAYLASAIKKSQFSKIQGRFPSLGNPPFILFRNHIWVRLDIAHGQK